ncbi:MAG: universal stress protein [Candidatus Ratteibacteria bacterium]
MRLKKLKNEILSDNSTKVNVEIRYGHPVKEIIAFSASNQVSLIVMGKQGRGFFKGSVYRQYKPKCSASVREPCSAHTYA